MRTPDIIALLGKLGIRASKKKAVDLEERIHRMLADAEWPTVEKLMAFGADEAVARETINHIAKVRSRSGPGMRCDSAMIGREERLGT